MADIEITIDGGTQKRLLTAGKYCDRNILVTATGGEGAEDIILSRQISGIYRNDRITILGPQALADCAKLEGVDFPHVTSINFGALQNTTMLTSVSIPATKKLENQVFFGCVNLKQISLPKIISIGYACFQNCTALVALVLPGETVCAVSSVTILSNTPIASGTGYIYVPSVLIEQYKVATNWVTYADQFRAIEEYPEITGG